VIDFKPKRQGGTTADALKRLESEGCVKQGSVMMCTKSVQGYQDCRIAVGFAHAIAGVESCNGNALLAGPDKTATSAGCSRIGDEIGNYICPTAASLSACKKLFDAKQVMACIPPPKVIDANILASSDKTMRGLGCKVPQGMKSVYSCPSKEGLQKCKELLKEDKIYGCEEKY
jgi:hypothetical protein